MALRASSGEDREFSFSDMEFRFLADTARAQTGIVLAEHKKDMVYSRIVRRLRALKLKSFSQYCTLLEGPDGETEMVHLINALTTNLTSFFREQHHFEHLRDHVLAPLATQPSARRIRLWSAACSAGMEPYSMAMVMRHALPDIDRRDARILATDIDTAMLATASHGTYPMAQYDNIPAEYRRHVQVDTTQDRMEMAETLKNMIAFKPLNLLESWPMEGQFDAVFCRNVVIYFDKPTQAELFNRMAEHIVPGGWLYIGHSENLFNVCDRFELLGRTIYRRVR
ncbi:MAG: CheR family methyltransferase [Rickettsiales bacterium]